MAGRPRILGLFAHPDDEAFCAGGTLAKYVAAGAEAMVVSATRGQAGQINDARVATRRTLAEVREREFRVAGEHLGVQHTICLDYMDGDLQEVDRSILAGDLAKFIDSFGPDVVITFGPDGAYGHPDHIAISLATTDACLSASADGGTRRSLRLYQSHFPRSRHLMLERLAGWLAEMKKTFMGTPDFVRALSIFATESTTMGYTSDVLDVVWSPPGSYIVEQGELSTSLYLILSGEVDVIQEDEQGSLRNLGRLVPGEFFGEIGVAYGRPRTANVVAADSVTCLVFAPGAATLYAGRGSGADLQGPMKAAAGFEEETSGATTIIDVTEFVEQKVAAIAAHRTQFPIEPSMFPLPMLREMFGKEYFVRALPRFEPETDLLGDTGDRTG